jgi:serine/threonine-protein kinase
VAKDALGELITEKRGSRLVTVRRMAIAPEAIDAVLAEVTAAAKLSSPSILRPIDASVSGGVVTIVSETIEGRTLRGLLTTLATTGEKLPVSHATWITIEVLKALEHAHARMDGAAPRPVFHGRLSPEHVVLTPSGQVRLTGFGLDAACRHLLKPQAKTDTAFAYLAPEQLGSGELNPSSDNFAVASILAELVLGKAVFIEDTFAATWDAIGNRQLPVLRQARDGVPKALDEAVTWALERHADRRCTRPDALRARLEAFQGVLDVGDRIKPDEHARRLSDLLRLRMKGPMTAATSDVTSMEPVSAPAAAPKKKGRAALRALKLLFAALAALLVIGIWARWPVLEDPVRRRIPPQVATALGIEPLGPLEAVPPPAADAGEAAPDAGAEPSDAGEAAPDAGEATADAGEAVAVPRPALVSIRSTPKAEVSLDGRPLGPTPLVDVTVDPGEHTLELVSARPKRKLVHKLVVAEGEAKTLDLELKKK